MSLENFFCFMEENQLKLKLFLKKESVKFSSSE